MGLEQTRKEVHELIAGHFSVNEDSHLMEQISSLEIIALVDYLEKKFSIAIEPIEVDRRNFSSLTTLAEFVELKRNATA
jgi:acyl carrier protein